MLKEFKAFVLRGNVVDLAVGVVIGAAFKTIVDSLVIGFINPIISFVSPGALKDKSFCVGGSVIQKGKSVCAHEFAYGEVITATISFVAIAAVVFFLVVKPLNHLMARLNRDEPTEEDTTRECPECLTSIPKAARRCSACTAEVAPA